MSTDHECFEKIINSPDLKIVNAGPLYQPIHEFTIQRDSDLKIIITTTSNCDAKSTAKEFSEGTVRITKESLILLTEISGFNISVTAISPHESIHDQKNNIITQKSSAHIVEGKKENLHEATYLIEWLENVDNSYYYFPSAIEKKISNKTVRKFGIQNDSFSIKTESSTYQLNRCVSLTVDGYKLYLGSSSKNKDDTSGFIIYTSCPSEEIRRKIRHSLSFALGNFLVYIGYSEFCSDWKLVSFKAISPYKFSKAMRKYPVTPPAPLHKNSLNMVDSNFLSRVVNALYLKYEICNFGHVSNLYWDGIFAPINIAAVYFGSAIEAIQESYIKKMGSEFKKSILNKTIWEELKTHFLKYISKQKIPQKEKKIIENKIKGLNSSPKDLLTKRFFEVLNMNFNELESIAWRRRDHAAHGVQKDDHLALIKEVKLLKIIFNRIILSITNGSDHYYDYYTVGNPCRIIRELKDSIPNGITTN